MFTLGGGRGTKRKKKFFYSFRTNKLCNLVIVVEEWAVKNTIFCSSDGVIEQNKSMQLLHVLMLIYI